MGNFVSGGFCAEDLPHHSHELDVDKDRPSMRGNVVRTSAMPIPGTSAMLKPGVAPASPGLRHRSPQRSPMSSAVAPVSPGSSPGRKKTMSVSCPLTPEARQQSPQHTPHLSPQQASPGSTQVPRGGQPTSPSSLRRAPSPPPVPPAFSFSEQPGCFGTVFSASAGVADSHNWKPSETPSFVGGASVSSLGPSVDANGKSWAHPWMMDSSARPEERLEQAKSGLLAVAVVPVENARGAVSSEGWTAMQGPLAPHGLSTPSLSRPEENVWSPSSVRSEVLTARSTLQQVESPKTPKRSIPIDVELLCAPPFPFHKVLGAGVEGPAILAAEYEALRSDDIDERVTFCARQLPVHLGRCLPIQRLSRGKYKIGGDRVDLAWHWSQRNIEEIFVHSPQCDIVSPGNDDKAAAMSRSESLPSYLEHSANVAYELQCGCAMSNVPQADRLSFADAEGTLTNASDAPAKLKAMILAAEQARQREAAALEFRANRGAFTGNNMSSSRGSPVTGTRSSPPGDASLNWVGASSGSPIKGLDPPLGLGFGLGHGFGPGGVHNSSKPMLAPLVY